MALELVRSFSNLYLPNTWQLVLGVFLLGVILFLPRGIGSLWIRDRRKRHISAEARSPPNEEPRRDPGSFGTHGSKSVLARWSPPTHSPSIFRPARRSA